MSSFRPVAAESRTHGFVPTPFESSRAEFVIGTPAGQSEPVVAGERESAAAIEEPEAGEATPPDDRLLLSEAEIAEREAAAFARGVEEARLANEADDRAFAALADAGRALARAAATRPHANREAIIELIGDAAECWVGGALRADSAHLLAALEAGLASLETTPPSRILLAPNDLDRLEREAAERLKQACAGDGLTIGADPELAEGEYRIELEGGVVDGRLASQRASLVETLRAALEAPPPEVEA